MGEEETSLAATALAAAQSLFHLQVTARTARSHPQQ